jgi:hypothetical protein
LLTPLTPADVLASAEHEFSRYPDWKMAATGGRSVSVYGRLRPGPHHRVPGGKMFHTWDLAASSIPAAMQRALRTLEWIARHENLCIAGPSGTRGIVMATIDEISWPSARELVTAHAEFSRAIDRNARHRAAYLPGESEGGDPGHGRNAWGGRCDR